MKTREEQLLQQFQSGEVGGFDAFYAEYGSRLYRFCYRLCGSKADAEDLTQEVFLAAFQGIERFESRASVATWLCRIAIYRHRRLKNRGENLALDEMPDLADNKNDEVTKIALESALTALPENLRIAFLLVKSEGFKYREAAEILAIPQGTIQYQVSEAITRLREMLGKMDEPKRKEKSNAM